MNDGHEFVVSHTRENRRADSGGIVIIRDIRDALSLSLSLDHRRDDREKEKEKRGKDLAAIWLRGFHGRW
jgi:hypothetical protein